jgi:hypothetical protein
MSHVNDGPTASGDLTDLIGKAQEIEQEKNQPALEQIDAHPGEAAVERPLVPPSPEVLLKMTELVSRTLNFASSKGLPFAPEDCGLFTREEYATFVAAHGAFLMVNSDTLGGISEAEQSKAMSRISLGVAVGGLVAANVAVLLIRRYKAAKAAQQPEESPAA